MPDSQLEEASAPSLGWRIAFAYPDFGRYLIARFLSAFGTEMQSVAVGWRIYEITHQPLSLGLAGLAQFLPGILLFLVSGHAADRVDRRKLMAACYLGLAICSALLLAMQLHGLRSAYPIYGVLILLGVVRSFSGPVTRAIFPQLVPQEHFPTAVAWNAMAFQTASIAGPAVGGLLYALFKGPAVVFGSAMASAAVAMFCTLRIRVQRPTKSPGAANVSTVLAGLRFIWQRKLILGSISLDLFAVLLGGAVALLPVYAGEILKTGPWGLGMLRSAPGVGAAIMAVVLANRPLRRRAGAIMLWCVAGFGLFTIVFGISRNFWLSLLSLLLVGSADMVSVVVRGTLIQVNTPDEMRGRVNAVDMIFIGASNELGQFESGVTAQWFGTVPAVVLGGLGAIVVTALWAWIFPDLRRAEQASATQT